jgi:hypothetical protein
MGRHVSRSAEAYALAQRVHQIGLDTAMKTRRLTTSRYGPESVFGDLWQYVSLLHDIGYLVEGAIDGPSWAVNHEMARRGAVVINEFFTQRL